MGKTKRNVPGWADKHDTKFIKYLSSEKRTRGTDISPKYMGKGKQGIGHFAGEGIRKPKTKKFFKKLHHKRNRKEVEESMKTVLNYLNEGSLGFRRQVRKNKGVDPVNIPKLQNKNTTREIRHPSKVKQGYADYHNMGPHRKVGSSISRSQYSGWHGYGVKKKK